MSEPIRAKTYLKSSCPFSFKFLMFMTEASLLGEIDVIRIDVNDEQELDKYRQLISDAIGLPATFPTVEIQPGQYMSDSDALIEYFSNIHKVDINSLPTFQYYLCSLFPAYLGFVKENRTLKAELQKIVN